MGLFFFGGVMSIRTEDLRLYVIRPTLEHLQLSSQAAENLLLGTAAQESQMGYYLHQLNGPALGIYQIEPATHQDVWQNYIDYRAPLSKKLLALGAMRESSLVTNLSYATAIARIIYLRVNAPLPEADDIAGLAQYYKTHYNTVKGKATVEEFIANYQRYIEHE